MTSDNSRQHCEAMDEATDDESPQSEQVCAKLMNKTITDGGVAPP